MFERYLVAYLVPDVEIFGIRAGAIGIGRRPGTGGSPRRGNLAGCQRTTCKARGGNRPLASALQHRKQKVGHRSQHQRPNTSTLIQFRHICPPNHILTPLHIHHPINRTSFDKPDIIRYIGHYSIHPKSSDKPDIIR